MTRWTTEETALCEEMWSRGGVVLDEISAAVGHSHTGIREKMRAIPRGPMPPSAGGAEFWTEEQIAALIRLWPDPKLTARDIGRKIGRGRNAVIGKAFRMHLVKGAPAGAVAMSTVAFRPLPVPKPMLVLPPIDYVPLRTVCACGGPCQRGRGACAECLTARHPRNKRADHWSGIRSAG